MLQEFFLSFRKEISLIEQPEAKQVVLQSPMQKLTFKQVTPGWRTALKILSSNGGKAKQLSQLVQQADGSYEMLKFYYQLQKWSNQGWICYSVLADKRPLATAIPLVWEHQFSCTEVKPQQKYVLSRFAYCHQVEGQMVLESPLSQVQVILPDWRSTALGAQLAKPQDCQDLATQIPGIAQETAKQFVILLLSTQMVFEVQEDDTIKEQTNITLAQWDFHDLLFHTRSRLGRHANPYGASSRFLGKIKPLPAVKHRMSEDVIELYKPDIEALKAVDAPFTRILEQRRSIRDYGEQPITAQQLGEFLYRSARVRSIIKTDAGEVSNRPYPGGGAIYELELYAVVNHCQNMPDGLYHYDPQAHQLCRLSGKTETVEELLKDAWYATGQQSMPQVLIIVAARFQRLAWKYESVAYALMLKHVGVLYQTMYLVATAMNLAPCGLGGGNSDLFAKVVGCDYYAETSIGEFALGSFPIAYNT